jgi:hypothetical protein
MDGLFLVCSTVPNRAIRAEASERIRWQRTGTVPGKCYFWSYFAMTTMMMRTLFAALLMSWISMPALAQHGHDDDHDHDHDHEHGHADIEFAYVDGKIDIEFGDEGAVFEGEFETEGVDRQFTTEPGFASELEEGMGIGAGDQVVYNVLGSLMFWNEGFKPVPTGAQLRIVNIPPAPVVPDTVITASSGVQLGSLTPPLNRIGEAEADGDFHTDLQFLLEPNTAPDPIDESLFGAYGVLMSLSTDAEGIDDSDPFFLVFNLGLEEATFEEGVEAFAAIVPEPASASLIVTALGALAFARRRSH